MADHTGAYHIGVDINHASRQMITAFYSRRMITVFPLRPLLIFSLVELLPGSPSHQFYGVGDHISISVIDNKEVDMVGSDHVIEDLQTIPLSCLIQPLQIAMPIP